MAQNTKKQNIKTTGKD